MKNIRKNISNSNWTEWSTIQGVTVHVNSKLDEREAQGHFEACLLPEFYDTRASYN